MFALPWLSSLVLKCPPLSSPIGWAFYVIWTAGMWPSQSPRQPETSIHISESQQRPRGVDFHCLYANNFCLASPCVLETSKNEYPTSPLGNLFWHFTTPGTKQSHPRWYKRFRNHQATNWRSTENAQRVQLYSEMSLAVCPSLRGEGGGGIDSISLAAVPECSFTFMVVPRSAGYFDAINNGFVLSVLKLTVHFSSYRFLSLHERIFTAVYTLCPCSLPENCLIGCAVSSEGETRRCNLYQGWVAVSLWLSQFTSNFPTHVKPEI